MQPQTEEHGTAPRWCALSSVYESASPLVHNSVLRLVKFQGANQVRYTICVVLNFVTTPCRKDVVGTVQAYTRSISLAITEPNRHG